jgi:hypothetical protein
VIHQVEVVVLIAAIAFTVVVVGAAVALLLTRAVLHLSWKIGRRLDANGRGGELLEALAKKTEGRSL